MTGDLGSVVSQPRPTAALSILQIMILWGYEPDSRSHRRNAMKLSARNVLKGKVKSVKPGVVNAEIVVELPGKMEIVSVITKESAESLKLKKGSEVYAVIKASNVMIAVD
jgi:molybdopterin-binding protein